MFFLFLHAFLKFHVDAADRVTTPDRLPLSSLTQILKKTCGSSPLPEKESAVETLSVTSMWNKRIGSKKISLQAFFLFLGHIIMTATLRGTPSYTVIHPHWQLSAHHDAPTTYLQLINTHTLKRLSPGPTIQNYIEKSMDLTHPHYFRSLDHPRVEDAASNCPFIITGLQDKGRRREEGGATLHLLHSQGAFTQQKD